MKLNDIILQPRYGLIIFIVILVAYLVFLDKEHAFKKKVLNFGPSPDSRFLNIQLDTWGKVITVYIVAFASALVNSYYTNITSLYVNWVLLNPAYKDPIKHSKFWSRILVSFDPIITAIMAALQFFVTLTMELQYILPQMIGSLIVTIPINLSSLKGKRFILD
jgi:predicted anti-sigma-YlaC factor YlaD